MSVLRRGDRGALVWELHRQLRQIGYALDADERRNSAFGLSTEHAVRLLQTASGLDDSGVLDQRTEDALAKRVADYRPPERYRVFGVVRQPSGQVAPDVVVEALDVDVFEIQPLGSATTNASGRYEITFTRERFAKAEQLGPDLLVRIADGRHPLRSPPRWPNVDLDGRRVSNAGGETRIDLVLGGGEYAGPSEWERILRVVRPILGEHPPRTLQPRQYAFITEETDLSNEIIAAFVLADAFADRTRELQTPVLNETLYALLRRAAWRSLEAIAAAPEERLRSVLASASAEVISVKPAGWIDEQIRNLAVLHRALVSASPVAAIGRIAQLDDATTTRVLSAFGKGRRPGDVWTELRGDTNLASKIPAIQRALHFRTLARGHFPLVEALERKFTLSQATSLGHFLGAFTETDWHELARTAGAPEGVDPAHYPSLLARTVERAFPTHVLAYRLQSHSAHRELAGYLAAAADSNDLDQAPVASWKSDGFDPTASSQDDGRSHTHPEAP